MARAICPRPCIICGELTVRRVARGGGRSCLTDGCPVQILWFDKHGRLVDICLSVMGVEEVPGPDLALLQASMFLGGMMA